LYITQSEPATSNADPSVPMTPAQTISHLSHLANVSSLFASQPMSVTAVAAMQKLRGEQQRASESETEEVRVRATRTSTHTLYVQARTTSNSDCTLPNMELTCVTDDIKHTTAKRQRRLSHSPDISFARPLNFSPPDEVEKKDNGEQNIEVKKNRVLAVEYRLRPRLLADYSPPDDARATHYVHPPTKPSTQTKCKSPESVCFLHITSTVTHGPLAATTIVKLANEKRTASRMSDTRVQRFKVN
jgi:hypothetical protein